MAFSAETRNQNIDILKEEKLDILVIGGGITGAGIVLHGAARDVNIGLIEMQDFAGGTSSRSTKLVHGGLRYLKQFDVELVADVAKERSIIGRNAPHIVQPDYMLMPVYDEPGASFNAFSAEVVLHLYDYLAEVENEWAHYLKDSKGVLQDEPLLKEENLLKGGYYLDYTNDDARLTIDTMKKANELGAKIVNYVKAVDFIYDENQKIKGVKAENIISGEAFEIEADIVVNASGPWSDEVRNKRENEKEKKMFPTKGVHFVVSHDKLPVNRTIYTDTGLEDNRMIFIIPRGSKTYFGTTDTPFEGPYEDPEITEADIDYLLKAVNQRFENIDLTLEDIESSWAGLRPLIKDEDNSDPSGISRGHEVFVSEDGLVTIAGGKLTDYRGMAEDTFETIDEIWKSRNISFKPVDTEKISLSGGNIDRTMSDFMASRRDAGLKRGLDEGEADYLADWYGSNIDDVYALTEEARELDIPLVDALQLLYGLKHEMIMSPEDFFGRRTDSLLFNVGKVEQLKEEVLSILAERLEWTDNDKTLWADQLEEEIALKTLKEIKNN